MRLGANNGVLLAVAASELQVVVCFVPVRVGFMQACTWIRPR